PGSPLPDPSSIPRLERPIARASVFLRHLFRFDLTSGRMDSSPGTPPDVAAWVNTNLPPLLRRRLDTQGEVATVSATIAGRPHALVYGASPDPERPFALVFEVDLEKLRPYLERAFRDEPLFPAPPGIGLPVSDLLFLESRDVWGRTLFTTRGSFEPALGIS